MLIYTYIYINIHTYFKGKDLIILVNVALIQVYYTNIFTKIFVSKAIFIDFYLGGTR